MHKWNWRPFVFVVFALALRIFYTTDNWVGIQGDAVQYVRLASDFFQHGLTGPDASRPPFYPLVLAIAAKVFHLGVGNLWLYTGLNCLFDLLSLLFLFRIGNRIAESTAFFGILFVALNPLWFGHVNSPVTEPVTVTLFLAFLDRWTMEKRTKKDEIWAGVYLSFLTLTRGMFLLFPIVLLLFEMLFRKAPKGYRLEGNRRLFFLAASFAAPFLWGLRNLAVGNHFIMTQSDDTAILMAWNAIKVPLLDWRIEAHRQFQLSHPWSDVLLGHADPKRTAEVFGLMRAEVIDFIKTHPFQYMGLFFPKALRLWVTGWWNPFSYAYSPEYLQSIFIGAFCVPILGLGIVGLIQQWMGAAKLNVSQWRATRAQALMALYITGITLPFTVDARYSLPSYVAFSLWMGMGIIWLSGKKRKSQ